MLPKDPNIVVATYEFPTVRRFLDHHRVGYRIDRDADAAWGSDPGLGHYVVRFDRVEDAVAFRLEHPHVVLDEKLFCGSLLLKPRPALPPASEIDASGLTEAMEAEMRTLTRLLSQPPVDLGDDFASQGC